MDKRGRPDEWRSRGRSLEGRADSTLGGWEDPTRSRCPPSWPALLTRAWLIPWDLGRRAALRCRAAIVSRSTDCNGEEALGSASGARTTQLTEDESPSAGSCSGSMTKLPPAVPEL